MVKASTNHAIAILKDFLAQCGGAQGALLELKYGVLKIEGLKASALRKAKDSILLTQRAIEEVLSELD